MGQVIYLPLEDTACDLPAFDCPRHLVAVHSFSTRNEAERAAEELVGHLGFPDDIAVVERRTRFRTRFELAVNVSDAPRAAAVRRLAARSRPHR